MIFIAITVQEMNIILLDRLGATAHRVTNVLDNRMNELGGVVSKQKLRYI